MDVAEGATREQLESRLEAGLAGFKKGFAEASEVHARPSHPREEDTPRHGRMGLALLVVIAVVVVAALYFTRR